MEIFEAAIAKVAVLDPVYKTWLFSASQLCVKLAQRREGARRLAAWTEEDNAVVATAMAAAGNAVAAEYIKRAEITRARRTEKESTVAAVTAEDKESHHRFIDKGSIQASAEFVRAVKCRRLLTFAGDVTTTAQWLRALHIAPRDHPTHSSPIPFPADASGVNVDPLSAPLPKKISVSRRR